MKYFYVICSVYFMNLRKEEINLKLETCLWHKFQVINDIDPGCRILWIVSVAVKWRDRQLRVVYFFLFYRNTWRWFVSERQLLITVLYGTEKTHKVRERERERGKERKRESEMDSWILNTKINNHCKAEKTYE